MIEFLRAPEHVLAARISGRFTAADVRRLTAQVDDRLARFRKVGSAT